MTKIISGSKDVEITYVTTGYKSKALIIHGYTLENNEFEIKITGNIIVSGWIEDDKDEEEGERLWK